MRLVPAHSTEMNNVNQSKVSQLLRLQARFLKYTETSQISKANYDVMAQKLPLYTTLRDMVLPPNLAKKPGTPLFHSVSHTIALDGYLVRYLPKYRTLALAALDGLIQPEAIIPDALGTTPLPSKGPNHPASGVLPRLSGHMGEIEQWIQSQFC